MKILYSVLAALTLLCSPAAAQWQTPNHSVPVGRGGGGIGFNSAVPGTAGLPLTSNGAASDPTFQAIANAGILPGTAGTVKCSTGGPAAVADCAAATFMNGAAISPLLGPTPFFDVKSNAAGCTAATGNGATDDATAIQCHINYMNTTYGGGTVYFPPGAYLVGTTLNVKGGIWLLGSSIDSTSIKTNTDIIVLNAYTDIPTGTCPSGGLNGGIRLISIYGMQSPSATQAAIKVGTNCLFNIYQSRVWFGSTGLLTAGTDGLVFDSFVCGYSTCVTSTGANWYVRTKLDAVIPGVMPTLASFAQNTSGMGIAENHFSQSDFSCGCSFSLLISDAASAAGFSESVFDSPISITSSRFTKFTASHFGSTTLTNAAGALVISASAGITAITASGAGFRSCAANFQLTC